jgi:PAS domain S-box-containing protein
VPIPNSVNILQAVIEATPDAIFVKDLEGRYVVVNAAAAKFLGRAPADVLGKNDLELYPEETARRFIEDDRFVLASGETRSFEGVAESTSGSEAYLVTKGPYRDESGRILGLYGISHDITELRTAYASLAQTREALFRSQKMEAVGQLTGGIAHDFNNILAVIIGNLELLRLHLQRASLPIDAHLDDLIHTVLRAALHGRELTGQLLSFAGRRQLHPQPVNVNGIVDGIVRLLGRTLGSAIDIVVDGSADAGVAVVDPAALEAAVLNIALNARDAMSDGGTLTIRTSTAAVIDTPATDDQPSPGKYAVLAVQDTGCGMTAEVVARAFEPFFTTKSERGGTGLGLSMVYGFARQSGGAVVIKSAPGAGTTVTMFLPLAPAAS